VAAAYVTLSLTACGNRDHIAIALPDSGAVVHGTVKFGKEDVQYALVVVQGADGATAAGMIDDEGRFHVPNAPLGEVKVAVNTNAARGVYQTAVMRGGAMTGSPEGGKSGRKKVNLKFIDLPARYLDPDTSGLKATVGHGDNTHDIVIPK
jgi:hypothetical protein